MAVAALPASSAGDGDSQLTLAPSLPAHPLQSELRYIARNTAPPRPPLASIPWRLLLSKPATWALIISHFCHNWGTFILLTWMPTYYNQVQRGRGGDGGAAQCGMRLLPWMQAVSAQPKPQQKP